MQMLLLDRDVLLKHCILLILIRTFKVPTSRAKRQRKIDFFPRNPLTKLFIPKSIFENTFKKMELIPIQLFNQIVRPAVEQFDSSTISKAQHFSSKEL
jgi:hypothetical protein